MPPIVKNEIVKEDGSLFNIEFTETNRTPLTNRNNAQTRIGIVLNANGVTDTDIHDAVYDDLVAEGII